jgi:uncharacterized protein (DUF2267 family)
MAFDFLAQLTARSGQPQPSAMAAAVLAPLAAGLKEPERISLLDLLPASLARSIVLQMPTTTAYASLDRYVSQVANQEGIHREQAIVHIALVLSTLAPHLPDSLHSAFGPDLTLLVRHGGMAAASR